MGSALQVFVGGGTTVLEASASWVQVKPLILVVAALEDGADYFKRFWEGEEGLLKVVLPL
jgi:hypothetical protein